MLPYTEAWKKKSSQERKASEVHTVLYEHNYFMIASKCFLMYHHYQQ